MTRVLLSLLTVAAILSQAKAQEPSAKSEGKGKVADELNSYFNSLAVENKLSGVVLVAHDGAIIASKAAGVANKSSGEPIKLDTKFNLGSLNKMFTAVAIAQLAQEGRLAFDDTISKHLPDYPNKEVADKVTIHQLLTHTSGIGTYWTEKFPAQRSQLTTIAAHLPLFVNEPLAFKPGEKFQYSNAGFMLLGAIVEKVSGQDYYSYVQDHIYKPAGMLNTGFYEPGKEIPNLAVGYSKMGPDGKPGEEVRDNTEMREVKGGPAGGGYSTAEDLVKFHTALQKYKLLNEDYTKRVTTGKVDAPRPIGRYAYGFGDKMFDGKHLVNHNGGSAGIAANFEMYPELGYTAVILMNSDPPTMMPVIMGIRQRIPTNF